MGRSTATPARRIHTSERNEWKRCKQRWDYTSPNRQHLEPIKPAAPLEFGTLYHAALAAYYDPATPRSTEVALEAWSFANNTQRDYYKRNIGALIPEESIEEALAEFDERTELGMKMLRHYTQKFAPYNDENLTCVWVEQGFDVRIKPRSREFYSFKPDALFLDADNRYWIGEWKTAASLYDSEEWLALDEQCGSYITYCQRALGITIEGVLYTTSAKAAPEPLKINKDGNPSSDKRQITSFDVAYAQLYKHFDAHIPPKYTELLTKLQAEGTSRFFKRDIVRRSQTEIERIGATIEVEVAEMRRDGRNPQLITRTPSRWNCEGCSFRQPCIEKWSGNEAGERELLETMFRVREN
jgi:hypothetical protein